jgi:hypothetical protein
MANFPSSPSVNQQYVDKSGQTWVYNQQGWSNVSTAGGPIGLKHTIASAAPIAPTFGDTWNNSSTGVISQWTYSAVTGASAWVPIGPEVGQSTNPADVFTAQAGELKLVQRWEMAFNTLSPYTNYALPPLDLSATFPIRTNSFFSLNLTFPAVNQAYIDGGITYLEIGGVWKDIGNVTKATSGTSNNVNGALNVDNTGTFHQDGGNLHFFSDAINTYLVTPTPKSMMGNFTLKYNNLATFWAAGIWSGRVKYAGSNAGAVYSAQRWVGA